MHALRIVSLALALLLAGWTAVLTLRACDGELVPPLDDTYIYLQYAQAAAEGHPASVMDMSFANQALSCEFVKKAGNSLEKKVYRVPRKIDQEIARLKLKSLGTRIDRLTPEQKKYLTSWELGT